MNQPDFNFYAEIMTDEGPTTTTVCTRYPHPDTWNSEMEHIAQVNRIRAMVGEIARLDAALFDAARDFACAHIDDLYSIETTLRQALEALDAADDRMTETEMRIG